MKPTHIIYEHGIEIKLLNGERCVPALMKGPSDDRFLFSDFLKKYAIRPVLSFEDFSEGESFIHILSIDGMRSLNLDCTNFRIASSLRASLWHKYLRFLYDIGSVMHHCISLAKCYADLSDDFSRHRSIPGYPADESGHVLFGGRHEIYYEFDALISAARRVYNELKMITWDKFGAGRDTPKKMDDMLHGVTSMPETVKHRMLASWQQHGARLKDYRDCAHHHTSLDIGNGSALLILLDGCIWSVRAPIPDNPEAKTHRGFTYQLNHDALTYAWELTNELINLALELHEAHPL
jgi:hypothetical protein